MKGRPVRAGDVATKAELILLGNASMKGRPFRAGDLEIVTTADGAQNPP